MSGIFRAIFAIMNFRKFPIILIASTFVIFLVLFQPGRVRSSQIDQPLPGEDVESAIDHRFGIVEAFWEPEDAAELRVGWDRILFYWNEIQPGGPDDWNTLHVLEEWLDDARDEDRMVMGLLKNTPAWATDAEPFSGVPRGLYLPVDDPNNLWAGYVRKVVDYYAPLGVHHWIIWNEPEIEAGVYGHEFSGSTRDYYQLLKVAYQVAKANDPDAVIHLAGWSYWHDPTWLNQFLNVAIADPEGAENNYFFDVITLHIYFRVETVEELVNQTWAIQRRYGLSKPIWINETNASPNLDPLWPVDRPNFQVDLEQQAWFIVQAHALGFGANSTSIGIYKLLDILLPPGGESFGILRPDGSRRPAFDAYRTTIEYLQDFTFPVGRQREDNFYAFSFKRPESVTRVLWSRNSMDMILKVPALADEALLVSALGDKKRTIQAYNGYYRIQLRGARCTPECDIGGPPVFLVEEVRDDFMVQSIPAIASEDSILATATPTPTSLSEFETPESEAILTVSSPASELTATSTAFPQNTSTPTSTPTPLPTITASPSVTPPATLALAAVEPVSPSGGREDNLEAVVETSRSDNSNEAPIPLMADSSRIYNSWVFMGIAVFVAGILVLVAVRHRQS